LTGTRSPSRRKWDERLFPAEAGGFPVDIPIMERLFAICLRRLWIGVAQRFSAAIGLLSEDGFSR